MRVAGGLLNSIRCGAANGPTVRRRRPMGRYDTGFRKTVPRFILRFSSLPQSAQTQWEIIARSRAGDFYTCSLVTAALCLSVNRVSFILDRL